MPICARCTAIYAGAIAGILMFIAVPRLRRTPLAGWMLLLALLPMVLDGGTQAIRIRESTNVLRLLTGAPAGALFLIFVLGRVERQTREDGVAPAGVS